MCWKYNVKWFLLCVERAFTMRISRNLRYEKKNDDRDGTYSTILPGPTIGSLYSVMSFNVTRNNITSPFSSLIGPT